jgi:diguanylate cyclase (GGDEF)-like protein
MKWLSASLSLTVIAGCWWLLLAAPAIGATTSMPRAALGWALLAFVATVAVARRSRRAGTFAAIFASVLFVVATVVQVQLDYGDVVFDAGDIASMVLAVAMLFGTPFVFGVLLERIERLQRQVSYQNSVIDDLTVRDSSAGAFKPRYVESILAEEIDRARRYHRSLALAIVSADDWDAVVRDNGEIGARSVASRIVDQLAKGTRTVDKIVQLGNGSFAIVLPETALEGAEVLAGRLQESTSAEAGITLRIGLADFPRDAVSAEGLYREAQEALTFARIAELLVVDRTLLGQGT